MIIVIIKKKRRYIKIIMIIYFVIIITIPIIKNVGKQMNFIVSYVRRKWKPSLSPYPKIIGNCSECIIINEKRTCEIIMKLI